MTTEKLIKLEDLVKPILEDDPLAREDDFYLYAEIVRFTHPEYLESNFVSALKYHKELHLPNYESITRVRRKLQEKYPHLASPKTIARREKERKEYEDYAKAY